MPQEEDNTVSLVPVLDKETNTFVLADYEKIKASAEKFIKDNSLFAKIEKPEDEKLCREERANLNNQLNTLKQARIKITAYYFGEFTEQVKEIERALQAASDLHSVSIHALEEAQGKESRAAWKIDCRTYDEEVARKIEAYAKGLGAKVTVKR